MSLQPSSSVASSKPSVNKSELCQRAGAKILIDDNLHYAEECATNGIRVLLFGDYPWNQAETLPDGVTRVKDWHAVVKELT